MAGGRFSIEAIFSGKDRFSPMLGSIQAKTGRFATGLGGAFKDAGSAVDHFAERLKTAAIVGAGLGAVVGAGLMKIGEAGAGFEHQMTKVGAVMGMSRAQIGDLNKAAMSLGVSTQFSSTEVGQAMEMLARKGFSATEVLASIPGVLNAIAASGEGMAEVATVVGSSIRGFGLDASKAAHVADVLAFTSEKVGAHITDMGTALSIAAPTAKALGVSIEDTAAAVGLLQKIGLDSSTAGTATATMLAKISKPSKDAAEQMAAMGIKFKDAKGDMLAFRDVLGQFVKAGDKVGGNMQRMAFFAELVGLRGDKAALALSDMAKSGEFDTLASGLKTVDGTAARIAGLNLDDSTGSWKLLTSTVEVLNDKLWELKSGALRGVVDGANAWLQANQDLIVSGVDAWLGRTIPLVERFGHGFAHGFISAIGPLERVAGWAMKLADVAPGLNGAAAAGERFGRASGALLTVALGVKAVSFAMGGLNTVMNANPWTLALGGLVAIGTAAYVYREEVAKFAHEHKVLVGIVGGGAVVFLGFATAQRAVAAATWTLNGARVALAGATRITAAAETFFTGEITATAVATDGAAASFVAADLALGPFLLTLGAVAVALGAVVYEWQELQKVAGGHAWAGVASFLSGNGFYNGVDEAMNEDARRKYAAEHTGVAGAPAPIGPPALPGAPAVSGEASAPAPGVMPALVGAAAGGVDSADLKELIAALKQQQAQKARDRCEDARGDQGRGEADRLRIETAGHAHQVRRAGTMTRKGSRTAAERTGPHSLPGVETCYAPRSG